MKHIYLSLLFVTTLLLCIGCINDVKDPGEGLMPEYIHPLWNVTNPAFILNDEIRVINAGDTSNSAGMATTWNFVTFTGISKVTFFWFFDGTSDEVVSFSTISIAGTETYYSAHNVGNGVYIAQVQFFGNQRAPLRFRFRFSMPPKSEAIISSFRYTTEIQPS